MARGSCVPSSTNTTPFSAKEMVCHTLSDTMFSREVTGSTPPLLARERTSPPTTTAMMPEAPMGSATR